MLFIIGYIIGILTAILIFMILAYFRASIEQRIKIIEKQMWNAGPKPKGAILLPEDDAEIARREIIEKNRAVGKDTHIDELR